VKSWFYAASSVVPQVPANHRRFSRWGKLETDELTVWTGTVTRDYRRVLRTPD